MASYITAEMPPPGGACSGTCADDIAAFLWQDVTPFSGSIVDGQTTMESNPGCGSCHTYNATDGTFSALGGDPIDVNAFRYPADPGNDYDRNFPVPSGPAHLSSFIETEMQLFGACTGACADNVAEYLWSLRD